MSGKSNISWTDFSWNPTVGCSRVSPGCDHCYAFALHDQRHNAYLAGNFPDAPAQYHKPFSEVQLIPARLEGPLRWRKPRRVFVDSMADLFHKDVPDEFLDVVFGIMAAAPRHTFQILTKRPQRMAHYLNDSEAKRRAWNAARPLVERTLQRDMYDVVPIPQEGRAKGPDWCYPEHWPPPNVWLGVSVENQDYAWRIDWLAKTPAAVRFLSCEPLLGPIDLGKWIGYAPTPEEAEALAEFREMFGELPENSLNAKIGRAQEAFRKSLWVIAGGESGKDFRPVDSDWLRGLRDQCVAAEVPFFLKQGSGLRPGMNRELDGQVWEQFPEHTS